MLLKRPYKFRKINSKTVTEIKNLKKKIMKKILKLLKQRNNLLFLSSQNKIQRSNQKLLSLFLNLFKNKNVEHKVLQKEIR
jgi:hypothetical protein